MVTSPISADENDSQPFGNVPTNKQTRNQSDRTKIFELDNSAVEQDVVRVERSQKHDCHYTTQGKSWFVMNKLTINQTPGVMERCPSYY